MFYQDAAGVNVTPMDYLERLAAMSNQPIYSWVEAAIGRGAVGGSVVITSARFEALADLAVRTLRGTSPDSIPITTPDLQSEAVDWRQLRRWHISESRVPKVASMRFREPSIFERYRAYLLGLMLLVITQTALIVLLAIQVVRRRHAEANVEAGQARLLASYERVRQLGSRLIVAQDAERARIARELHDDIGQQLTLLSIDLDLLTSADDDSARPPQRIPRLLLDRAHQIARTVHDISHRLHPGRLRFLGLVEALQTLQRETMSQQRAPIRFSHDNVPAELPHELSLAVYRVAQEALQNAIKYSGATQIAVNLVGGPDGISLSIIDDGAGFDPGAVQRAGLGLSTMAERLEPFGGSLIIKSTPGTGTHIEAIAPASAVAAEQPSAGRQISA